jgi:thiol-disulfide isomerase/thioredoxin
MRQLMQTKTNMNSFISNFLKFLFLTLFLFSCTKESSKPFSISGNISPTKADYITLQQETDIERKIETIIDTLKVDDEGNFKSSYNEAPYLYSLVLPNKKKIGLAINKDQKLTITISNYDDKDQTVTIEGSKDSQALLAYENFREESLDRLVQSVRREIKELKKAENPDTAKIAELGQLEVDNYDKHLAELNAYISKNMDNTLGLYATSIRWKGTENFALFDSLTTEFEAVHPNLEITSKLREKVTRLQQTEVGGKVADIHMNTVDGTQVNLSSIKAKYILIDFWASWCGPCRRESDGLNKIYANYSREYFDIYGVSLDDKRDKWIAALEKDNRIWTNVSSLEGFKTTAAFDYTVTALPDNYLIDANRIIIAKNIHGAELEKLLDSLITKN